MKKLGPGFLIAAAFIGPGTVTTCLLAGSNFGYALLWALLFSVLATIVLQEMAARLGVVTQKGLAECITTAIRARWARWLILLLILTAILIGNAAYQGGNVGGSALGLEAIFGSTYKNSYPYILGLIAFSLLWIGNYRILEKAFLILIVLMSLSFVVTAIVINPDWGQLFGGLVVPTFPKGGVLTIVALVGTTIVPYNLFLHASLVKEKWNSPNDLSSARVDTILSIALGGMVSMAIVVAATAIPANTAKGVLDLAKSLEPLYGSIANYCMGVGLFAAGITSSVTAPLAAAYVANSCFGWQAGLKDVKFRLVWIGILLFGVLSLSLGYSPIQIIQFAQVANGVLLPVIAILLVWITSSNAILGVHKNGPITKSVGVVIVLLSVLLGVKGIVKVIGLL